MRSFIAVYVRAAHAPSAARQAVAFLVALLALAGAWTEYVCHINAEHSVPAAERSLFTPRQALAPEPAQARIDTILSAADTGTLAAATGFPRWPCSVTGRSRAKWLPRRICRSTDPTLVMTVAETLRPDGSVRETEVVLAHGPDAARVSFLVFDASGRRSDLADFGTLAHPVLLPAPSICLRCHADPRTGRVLLRPVFAEPPA